VVFFAGVSAQHPPVRSSVPTSVGTLVTHGKAGVCARISIKAAQEGREPSEVQPVLNVSSYAELSRLLSPKNLELLETISEHEPASIRETARLVDRDYKQVHQNLTELEEIGVIEFEGGGSGRPRKPLLAYDGLEIDLPFTGDSPTDAATS
jgi:predicted transcriptional regulator